MTDVVEADIKHLIGGLKKYHEFLRENFEPPSTGNVVNMPDIRQKLDAGDELIEELESRVTKLCEVVEKKSKETPSANAEVVYFKGTTLYTGVDKNYNLYNLNKRSYANGPIKRIQGL
ncbi:MAG: hypothetical protein ACW99G_18260 [Candidatus Thorarchaeota archaeon]|jgi:hypothetical protein